MIMKKKVIFLSQKSFVQLEMVRISSDNLTYIHICMLLIVKVPKIRKNSVRIYLKEHRLQLENDQQQL